MAAVLIVDDDDVVRDTLFDLFSEGHLCHSASTEENALAFLSVETYDVVLTDFSMPGLEPISERARLA